MIEVPVWLLYVGPIANLLAIASGFLALIYRSGRLVEAMEATQEDIKEIAPIVHSNKVEIGRIKGHLNLNGVH